MVEAIDYGQAMRYGAAAVVLALLLAGQEAPAGYPGQSNLVPPGAPTPTTAYERLTPGGPPRDPGPNDWAVPGPYISPSWSDFSLRSFSSAQRLATTYYFYWHDLTDPERRARFSGRFHVPPDAANYSFLSSATHRREFSDMLYAGLDFVLPVYWGEPGHPGRTTGPTSPHYWSTEGIPAMVEALDTLGRPLQVGLFYDTTILANADLTTPSGKEYFYVNVRDFYSRIPPYHWAAIDQRPVVWLYDTVWVSRFDQSSIDYLSERFAQDFAGLRLFVVRESQWQNSKGLQPAIPVRGDGLYAWGAAPFGFNASPELTIAQVGPGFKNTQYCTGGAERNCFDVDREGGRRYEQQLQQATVSGRQIIAIETWNEFSEGSDIQETLETGRLYLDLTRQHIEAWKAGL
ncbi:MAG: DUF5010 domain-containing protein [Chloroflexota bacterium]|nr:DUF5010 domain-containing protein [Chloroflexota bacterium]